MFLNPKCGVDNPCLDDKSFLTARLDLGDAFLAVGWMTAVVVEVLVGVSRFSIKKCNKPSLIIDDT